MERFSSQANRMTAVASTAPTVTVKVYKNGNRNFLGKTLVINRRHIRTMDALYDEVTAHIAAFNAVRKICTPIGGRPVQSLESIQNKSVYVAAGREEFKKLNYADLGVSKPRPPRKTNHSPKKTVIVAEGRHMMDYEWGKRDLKIIHVYCNGNMFKPSVKIVLQKRLQQSMEQILSIVQQHVFLAAVIAALYTIDGKLVLTPAELVTGRSYVAVERGRFFKRGNYGGAASSLTRSPRAPFFPQIGNGQLTNTEGRLLRKNMTKRKPRVKKTNAENKTSEQSRDQSRVTNVTSVASPRDFIPNSFPDPPAAQGLTLLRESQDLESINNFTISASPPGLLEDDTPVPEDTPLVKAENNEDENLTVGNVFKASGLLQEKADEIRDTRQTKEEKPIDLLPAEVVMEEVLEQVDDVITKPSDEACDIDSRDNERTEEVEDEVETIEDNSTNEQVVNKVDKSQLQAWENDAPEDESESRPAAEDSNKKDNSRHSPKEGGDKLSASVEIQDNNTTDDAVKSEKKDKNGEADGGSSSADKPTSPTPDNKDENRPPSSEPEKSVDESAESEEDENELKSEEENVTKNESEDDQTREDAALNSNKNSKNSVNDKGSSDT